MKGLLLAAARLLEKDIAQAAEPLLNTGKSDGA